MKETDGVPPRPPKPASAFEASSTFEVRFGLRGIFNLRSPLRPPISSKSASPRLPSHLRLQSASDGLGFSQPLPRHQAVQLQSASASSPPQLQSASASAPSGLGPQSASILSLGVGPQPRPRPRSASAPVGLGPQPRPRPPASASAPVSLGAPTSASDLFGQELPPRAA